MKAHPEAPGRLSQLGSRVHNDWSTARRWRPEETSRNRILSRLASTVTSSPLSKS